MSKITVIIEHSGSSHSSPQKITLEGQEDYLPRALEFLELTLRCMGFIIDGQKLELLSTEEELAE